MSCEEANNSTALLALVPVRDLKKRLARQGCITTSSTAKSSTLSAISTALISLVTNPMRWKKALSKFEAQLGNALQIIRSERTLDNQDARNTLLNLASVVATRNPELRARMEDFQRRIYELVADTEFTRNLRF